MGEMSANKDMVFRSFQKVGIAVADVDRSEDSLIEGSEQKKNDEDIDEDPFGESDEDTWMKTQTLLQEMKMLQLKVKSPTILKIKDPVHFS